LNKTISRENLSFYRLISTANGLISLREIIAEIKTDNQKWIEGRQSTRLKM